MIKEYGIYVSEEREIVSIIIPENKILTTIIDIPFSFFNNYKCFTNIGVYNSLTLNYKCITYDQIFSCKSSLLPNILKNYGYLGQLEDNLNFKNTLRKHIEYLTLKYSKGEIKIKTK